MAITFPRVAEVEVGEPVSSRHLAQLAEAINARLRSGLGDGAYRLVQYWLNAFRQIRNPDALGNFPSQAEFFTTYQQLGPEWSWPDAGPGDFEGVNVSSFAPSYVFGNSQGNVYDEKTRLVIDGVPVSVAGSASAAWQLAKEQRGAYDPQTRGVACPAFTAAMSYSALTRGQYTPHGQSYGGFYPIPDALGICTDGTESLELKWTNIGTGSVLTFSGTCSDVSGDVGAVYAMPLGWYVVKNSGETTYLPRAEWIEGPYTRGEHPRHTWGEHLPRIFAGFSAEFRGTPSQRQDELGGRKWLGNAFSISGFLTRPYYLAPSFGTEIAPGQVFAVYPQGSVSRNAGQSIAGGTQIGGTLKTEDGFGIAAVYVESSGLAEPATVEFLNGDRVFATATVSRTNTAAVVTLPEYETGTNLRARLAGSASFSSAGAIRVEWAHLQQYKPNLIDLFVVLRLSGAKLQDSQQTDGSGLAEDKALAMWQTYVSTGCIALAGDHAELESSTTLSDNAVFDSMRRMSHVVRVVPRQNITGYAVENGNSVVWVNPRAFATPRAANASLLEGITDAIKTKADPRGYSNEWVGFVNAHPYHVSESSLWKPSVFADYFPILDRCGFYAPQSAHVGPTSVEMRRFVTYGANFGSEDIDVLIAPEYASGYRYAKGNNRNAVGNPSFYKSCRIYEPPLAIKSAESQTDGTVKITFDGRFHHHESAPASISRDIGTWDIAALTAEADDYRTEENALREYLVHAQGSGSYQCSRIGYGNSEAGRIVDGIPDNPFGACYPTLFLVQQIPKPYADGNDRQDANDTPLESAPLRMAELYLRVMCEGFIDTQTSAKSGCDVGATFEFTWANCCYRATGLPWLQMIGDTPSKWLKASEVREDAPEGFGPMPTTVPAANVFNGFARVVNSLTRVRVTLPWELEVSRSTTGSTTTPSGGFRRSDGAALDCSTYTGGGLFYEGGHPDAPTGGSWGAWTVAAYAQSQLDTVVAYSGSSYTCSGSNFQLYSQRWDERYRIKLVDTDALNAIPDSWRGMLDTDAEFVASQATSQRKVAWTDGTAGTGETCGGSAGWSDGAGGEYSITFPDVTETTCGKFPLDDTVHAPTQSSLRLAAGKNGAALCDAGATYSSGIVTRSLTPVDPSAFILAVPLSDPAEPS